ncbi:MAG TPA: hypothetical protein PLZ55_12765 [bacterium]|nr:hypothetical protein [bacterium]HPO09536.1 hypothetical protein [bacterium]HQO33227.1 hypothetical protein [bacterium]HQP99870.1 hypothetical protein [bacterium]
MSEEYRGICSTCIYVSTCRLPSPHVGPVSHCEGFDSRTDIPARIAPPAIPGESNRSERDNHYTGLCSDCENMESCAFLEPEGGVWHCEEYR